MLMSSAFQIPVSCRVTWSGLAIISVAFMSVVQLLSTVTSYRRYLNLFTRTNSLHIMGSVIGRVNDAHVFATLISSLLPLLNLNLNLELQFLW